METPTTADRILDSAEALWVRGGFHAFSYHDIAAEVGLKTASIHYYFPTKADLAEAVLARNRERLRAALAGIDAECAGAAVRLRRCIALFGTSLGEAGRLCPFCAAALSVEDMAAPVRAQLHAFWRETEQWLEAVLEAGRRNGEFAFYGRPGAAARAVLALVEGAMIAARGLGEPGRFRTVVEWLETNLQPHRQPTAQARRARAGGR
jgi:TetR/AcrR family transcriptional repressor of nem operon